MTGLVSTTLVKTRATEGRAWVTALAVFALLAYSVLAGLAGAASAQPQTVDSLGNPICASHGGDGTRNLPEGPGDHRHPDCCFAGCNSLGPHAVAPAAQAFLFFRPLERSYAALSGHQLVDNTFEWTPLNPRAPPAAV
jgi:hypothetical protein